MVAEKRMEREEDLNALKARAEVLEGDIEHLQSDRGLEEELRSRFDVAKEGEQVIIIVEDYDDTQARTVPRTRERQEDSFFEKLKFWQ